MAGSIVGGRADMQVGLKVSSCPLDDWNQTGRSDTEMFSAPVGGDGCVRLPANAAGYYPFIK